MLTEERSAATERAPFRLGVNYWPAKSAMGFWRSWDEQQLDRDFKAIEQVGLDSVRLFLTWEDFQPSPEVVDSKMLELLRRTLDRASALGVLVMPTLFTGHMSGANWLPGWAVGRARGAQRFPVVCGGRVVPAEPVDWYGSESVRRAQTMLASECAAALAGHPALLAWDLGNENSNCAVPDSRGAARSWLLAMRDAIRERDPHTPITIGLHMEDLEEDRGLTPREAAEACDFLTMHGYPGYANFTRGPTDERLLPFLAQLTRFLGSDKDVFFTEFGVPTLPEFVDSGRSMAKKMDGTPELVDQEDAASYVHRGLQALSQCGATGAMLWCFSDYAPEISRREPFLSAPHELSFGVFHSDGSPKPTVAVVRSFHRTSPRVANPPRIAEESFIDLSPDDYYDDPQRHMPRLYRRYCAALGDSHPFQ